jgi:hypothetical protein
MRLFNAFLVAAAASLAAPLAAQEANDVAVAENTVAPAPTAPDANAADANALDANLIAPPVDDTLVAEETVAAEETAAPADRDGGGFPWGALGLLGLLGLIPRLRR